MSKVNDTFQLFDFGNIHYNEGNDIQTSSFNYQSIFQNELDSHFHSSQAMSASNYSFFNSSLTDDEIECNSDNVTIANHPQISSRDPMSLDGVEEKALSQKPSDKESREKNFGPKLKTTF